MLDWNVSHGHVETKTPASGLHSYGVEELLVGKPTFRLG
jgi:hypothetical protein